jgi:hypothetical protein
VIKNKKSGFSLKFSDMCEGFRRDFVERVIASQTLVAELQDQVTKQQEIIRCWKAYEAGERGTADEQEKHNCAYCGVPFYSDDPQTCAENDASECNIWCEMCNLSDMVACDVCHYPTCSVHATACCDQEICAICIKEHSSMNTEHTLGVRKKQKLMPAMK